MATCAQHSTDVGDISNEQFGDGNTGQSKRGCCREGAGELDGYGYFQRCEMREALGEPRQVMTFDGGQHCCADLTR